MSRFPRSLAVLLLCGASAVAGYLGLDAVQSAQFARAEEQIETVRQDLARVEDLSSVFRHVGRVVEPSVVSISVVRAVPGPQRRLPMDEDMLRRFFPEGLPDGLEEPQLPQQRPMMGTGSGVIMEAENGYAYILTNNHVAGGATELVIVLHDGRRIDNGRVIGTDPRTDLAIIQVQSDRLVAARWGDSDRLTKGDWVLAFGSPFGYVGSMTHGIVSALERDVGILRDRRTGMAGYENFIQTDAAINPGNSGGPLVNIRGEVVGINTAIASRTGGFMGIGFAIPSNQARFVYQQLREHGRVVRGWLGVNIADVGTPMPEIQEAVRALGYEQHTGVYVRDVIVNTPAFGQLEPGDIITGMNGQPIENTRQLRNMIAATAPGTEVTFEIFRERETQEVQVRLGEQPDDPMAAADPARTEPAPTATADTLGMQLSNADQRMAQRFGLRNTRGAVITSIDPVSPAAQAGLRVGDMITRVNDQRVSNAREASEAIANADLAEGVRLYVTSREGTRLIFLRVQE